jgi:hypothetical protein
MSAPHLTNGTSGATIFSRIFESSQEGISPEFARYILGLGFSTEDRSRMQELATKNRRGEISHQELSNSHYEVLAGIGRPRDLQSLEHEVEQLVPALKQKVAQQRLQVLKESLPGRQGLPHPVVLGIHPPQQRMEQKC